VVIYSFTWSGFAAPDSTLTIGDAFAGGLYLPRENTLVLRYPGGWSVRSAEPLPDDDRNGLAWYGLRSFAPGEPRVVLERPASLLPLATAAVIILLIVAGTGLLVFRRMKNRQDPGNDPGAGEAAAAILLTAEEEAGLEERILALLEAAGGEQYQSEIVKSLGLPKSTVSSSIAGLHARGLVVKVKKGRENLIRLARDRQTAR